MKATFRPKRSNPRGVMARSTAGETAVEIDPSYTGREHSWVKHQLLKHYLATVLSIIGVAGKTRSITYVDCFAGPWGDPSEDLSGTSIAISLQIIDKVREDMAKRPGLPSITFRAVFVEKDRARHARLSEYLAGGAPSGLECHALAGDYVDQQDEILRLCGKSFTFFFVDPKGWASVSISRLSKLLRREHSEFLINFMYDFINRAVGIRSVRSQIEELLGALDDQDLADLKAADSQDRSDWLVNRYRNALKQTMGLANADRPRSFHAEVLNPSKERLHYHLVYLTRHHKGLVKFAESSERAEFLQSVVRTQARHSAESQIGLFSVADGAEHQQAGRVDGHAVERRLLALITDVPLAFGEAVLADLLEDTGWFVRDIEAALQRLIARRAIQNLDAPKARPKHPVHFRENERVVRIG